MFSSYSYVLLAGLIFVCMFIPLSILSELLFIEPFFVYHVVEDMTISFVLIISISFMSAIVIPMNVYRVRTLQKSRTKISGSVVGAIIGASAGICSCGPIGFSIISIFGSYFLLVNFLDFLDFLTRDFLTLDFLLFEGIFISYIITI